MTNANDLLSQTIARHLQGHESHPSYQRWFDDYLNLEKRHLKQLVVDMKTYVSLSGKRVLDFGCGTGGSTVAIALQGAEVIGIEPNPLSVDVANARIKKYSLESKAKVSHLSNTLELAFADGTFDVIVCYSVLEYILRDRKEFIREMWRVLKKDGVLFVGGTSNGIWPFEMHSKKWWINYEKNLDEKVSNSQGISYWEIKDALKDLPHEFLNQKVHGDPLKRYASRHKGMKLYVFLSILNVLKYTVCPLFRVPVDVFMPWLDVAFEKKG